MMRAERDFAARELWEQKWMIKNTWCDICNVADLGIVDPVEYEENNEIVVEDKCRKCGSHVITSIVENNKTD